MQSMHVIKENLSIAALAVSAIVCVSCTSRQKPLPRAEAIQLAQDSIADRLAKWNSYETTASCSPDGDWVIVFQESGYMIGHDYLVLVTPEGQVRRKGQ